MREANGNILQQTNIALACGSSGLQTLYPGCRSANPSIENESRQAGRLFDFLCPVQLRLAEAFTYPESIGPCRQPQCWTFLPLTGYVSSDGARGNRSVNSLTPPSGAPTTILVKLTKALCPIAQKCDRFAQKMSCQRSGWAGNGCWAMAGWQRTGLAQADAAASASVRSLLQSPGLRRSSVFAGQIASRRDGPGRQEVLQAGFGETIDSRRLRSLLKRDGLLSGDCRVSECQRLCGDSCRVQRDLRRRQPSAAKLSAQSETVAGSGMT